MVYLSGAFGNPKIKISSSNQHIFVLTIYIISKKKQKLNKNSCTITYRTTVVLSGFGNN